MSKKWVVLGVFCWFLQACTQIDDFMLGKDNTPKPTELVSLKSKTKLDLNWSIPTGKSTKSDSFLKLKPAIHKAVVYTADASGQVLAIDKNTSHVVWSVQLKEGLVSGPTVAEGVVALGTNASSFVLLNQADGRQLMRKNVSGEVLSKPIISNHRVIVKTIDGNLYAFDLKTGKKLWMSEHGAPHLILKASSSPILLGKLVLVGFSDGKLDAVDVETGRVVWQRSIAYASGSSDVERLVDIDADPLARGDTVYLATYQGYVGALTLSNGQFLWSKPSSIYKNMAIDDENVYVSDNDDVLWAISRQTGHVKWKQTALKARGITAPALMGSRLVVGDKTGLLHVLSTQDGEFVSRQQLSGPIYFDPAISGRYIYVMTANGKLNRLTIG